MRHKPCAGFPDAPCLPPCALSNLSRGLTAQRIFPQDLWLKIIVWSHSMKCWAPVEDSFSAGTNRYSVLCRDNFSSVVRFCGHSRPQLWKTADTGSVLLNISVSLILLPSRYGTKHHSLYGDWSRFLSGVNAPRHCVFDPSSELRNTQACLGLSDWDGGCCCTYRRRDQPDNWGWMADTEM